MCHVWFGRFLPVWKKWFPCEGKNTFLPGRNSTIAVYNILFTCNMTDLFKPSQFHDICIKKIIDCFVLLQSCVEDKLPSTGWGIISCFNHKLASDLTIIQFNTTQRPLYQNTS